MEQEPLEELRRGLAASPPPRTDRERCRAAVLLPLLLAPGARRELFPRGTSVLFTLRTMDLPTHKGQVSFPGGALEKGEEPAAAALRETEEELGIPPAEVDLLGWLGSFSTLTSGWEIDAFPGLLPHRKLAPNPREVARVFQIPLAGLRAHLRQIRPLSGPGIWPTFPHREGNRHYTIWGATARILAAFLDRADFPLEGA
jgi:8-oxo-dGTP pyrophosphatase MutT (NUDIX family)